MADFVDTHEAESVEDLPQGNLIDILDGGSKSATEATPTTQAVAIQNTQRVSKPAVKLDKCKLQREHVEIFIAVNERILSDCVEETHERCARLIEARAKDGVDDKISSNR